ncbi:MAG TPA: pilus assembly protein N-terminal domain-containing protein, partial [Acetobacteraceae bacterium]
MRPYVRQIGMICIAAMVGAVPMAPGWAQPSASAAAPADDGTAPATRPVAADRSGITVEAGTGRVMQLPGPAANVFVADPKVAEVRPASATNLFVFGVASGHTTVAAMDTAGRVLAQYDVTVQPSAFNAREAQTAITRLVPGSRVKVTAQSRGLLLTGSVGSAADAAQAMAIAKGFATETASIDNELNIESPVQVTLHVRIAEMSRTVVRNLGVNWQALATIGSIAHTPALTFNINSNTLSCGQASGGVAGVCPGANFNGVIDALAKDNLAHV